MPQLYVWEQCKFRGYWNQWPIIFLKAMFESSVNSEGIETQAFHLAQTLRFESSVNSEGIETVKRLQCYSPCVWEQCKFRGYWNLFNNRNVFTLFESSVNSEGIETIETRNLNFVYVWEQCKFRGYWNAWMLVRQLFNVWEQCKFRGYWNFWISTQHILLFESSVNSEGIETPHYWHQLQHSLRAV